MVKTRYFLIPIIIILAFSFLFISFNKTEIPTTSLTLFHYTGAFAWMDDHPTPLTISGTAQLGDYKIVVNTDSRRYDEVYKDIFPTYECLPNSCNGLFKEVQEKPEYAEDDLGCQIWEYDYSYGVSTVGSICDSACSACYGKSNINLGDSHRACGNSVGVTTCAGVNNKACTTATSTATCGGYKATNVINTRDDITCWWNAEIYKDGVILKKIPWNTYRGQMFIFDGLQAHFSLDYLVEYSMCRAMRNEYHYVLDADKIDADIITTNNNGNIKSTLQVTNNLKEFPAKIINTYTLDTGLSNPSTESRESYVTVKLGSNSYVEDLELPAIGTLEVVTIIYALSDGSEFSGLNGFCFEGDNTLSSLSDCEYVEFGSYTETKTIELGEPDPLPEPEDNHFLHWLIIGTFVLVIFGIVFFIMYASKH